MKIQVFASTAVIACLLVNTAFSQLADPTLNWRNTPVVTENEPCVKNPPRARDEKYPTTSLAEATRAKDIAKGLVFYNEAQTNAARVYIRDGIVYGILPNGACGRIVDSNRNKSGNYHYVMDADGNLYIFDEETFPKIRHSSVLGNMTKDGAVAGAGEIRFENGRITYIDANSGHYNSRNLLENVKRELRSHGVQIR